MTVTPEQIAAYADGELDELTAARIARAVADSPELAAQLAAHLGLRDTLSAHFAPILEEPVPEAIGAPIAAAAKVVDLGAVREQRAAWWRAPAVRWGAPALAASLALAVLLPRGGETAEGYAPTQLAAALEATSSGTATNGTRVLLSFRDKAGAFCRGYASPAQSGIACKDDAGWKLRMTAGGSAAQAGEFRQAGSGEAAVMAAAQDLAAGSALDGPGERAARANGWRAP
ncbi:MAG: anti-sigma factor family protein [Novosphingobium sp.]